jgi:hypothetical protein
MKKNTLADLNDHFFAEIERLSDEDLKGEELAQEISRADAITAVATQVIANGQLVLKSCQFKDGQWSDSPIVPRMLSGGGNE